MAADLTTRVQIAGWDPALRPRLRLDQVLREAAARSRHDTAVIDARGPISFGELDRLVSRLGDQLVGAGVSRGSRVAVSVPNTAMGVALVYAVSRAGGVSVPLNPYWITAEITDALHRAEVSHLVVVEEANEAADAVLAAISGDAERDRPMTGVLGASAEMSWGRPVTPASPPTSASPAGAVPRVGDDDVAMILFTSGSTAAAKGVLLTHDAMVGVAHFFRLSFAFTPQDRYLLLMPIYHVGGLVDGLLGPHLAGAATVMAPRFEPELLLELMEREHVSATAAFDSMFHKLLTADRYSPHRHASLRRVSGGENDGSYQRLLDIGVEAILPSYGLTEVSSGVSMAHPDRPAAHWRGTVGAPTPGLEVVVIDPETEQECPTGVRGEIRVRGWAVSPGYIDGTDGRDDRGYLRTGDLGSFREDGALRFEGRLKQMIKSGGENVSALEVQKTLMEGLPEIAEAAVVGVPDPEWGEMVVAFVEFHSGVAVTTDDVMLRSRDLLAGYKRPKAVWEILTGQWPMLPAGKLDRAALQRLAADRLQR